VSTPFEKLRIADGVEQLPETAWQSLVVGHPALRLEVLQAIQSTATRPIRLQFFLLEDEVGLAAAAVCEPVATSAMDNPLDALLFGRAAGAVRRLGVSTQPALLFMTPVGREAPLVLRPSPPTEQRRILGRLLDGIEEHAAARKLGIAFIGVTTEDAVLQSALRERRYLESEIDATARLDIEWTDFDSYVEHLRKRSKSSAQNARHERNRNRKSGVNIRRLRLGAGDVSGAEALCAIARDHWRHKNGSDPFYGPRFMPLLSNLLGDDFLIFEAVRDGKCTAMLGVVRSGSVGWMQWIGVDPRDRPNDYTYANLSFYHAADWGPALGLKTLLYGTAVQQAKVWRGCRSIASHVYYRPQRPMVRPVARAYLSVHRAWLRRKSR